jgi:phosphocarrier protein
MMLAAGLGAEIELDCDGIDEQEALRAITSLIDDKFGEGQ